MPQTKHHAYITSSVTTQMSYSVQSQQTMPSDRAGTKQHFHKKMLYRYSFLRQFE